MSSFPDIIRPGDGDRRHGTPGGYSNNKCRCTECRAASAAYMRNYWRTHPEQYEKHKARVRQARKRAV